MFAKLIEGVRNRLSRKRNPLLRDPAYAGFDALEQHMRAKHMNAAAARRAKQDRLHELLRGARI